MASFSGIFACFILKEQKAESRKRLFCIIAGMAIQFFVFGMSAFASFIQNLLSYVLMVSLPYKHAHVAVFVSSATMLALAQLHK